MSARNGASTSGAPVTAEGAARSLVVRLPVRRISLTSAVLVAVLLGTLSGCGHPGRVGGPRADASREPAPLSNHTVVVAGPVAFIIPSSAAPSSVPNADARSGPTLVAVWRLNRDPCQPGLRARLRKRLLGRCGTFAVDGNSLLVVDNAAELEHFPFGVPFTRASRCLGVMFTALDTGNPAFAKLMPGDLVDLDLRPLKPSDGRRVPDLEAATRSRAELHSADFKLERPDVRRAIAKIGC